MATAPAPVNCSLRAALVAALRRRPRSTPQLVEATDRLPHDVLSTLGRNPQLFARANPDVRATKARPAVWRLRTRGENVPAVKRRMCRHCGRKAANRPRKLCWSCFYSPGVKDQYPPTQAHGARGIGRFTGGAPAPDAPTTAAPGTWEKIVVMQERIEAKRQPHHPFDARYEGDPSPVEWARGRAAS